MTTIRYQGIDEILRSLDNVRGRRWSLRVATGAIAFLGMAVISLLMVAVSLGYWDGQPPAGLRWTLLGGVCLLWSAALVWLVFRPMAEKPNPAELARFVEQATPDLRNDLINSVQLSRDAGQVSPEFVQEAIHEAVRKARGVDMARAISRKPLQRWGLVTGVALAAMLTFGLLQPQVLARGLQAVLKPRDYLSRQGSVEFLAVTPGDTVIYANTTVTVTAKVKNPTSTALPAHILLEGGRQREMVASDGYTTFAAPLGRIDQTMRYAVKIGDTTYPLEKDWYVISVVQRVDVAGIDRTYRYPPYTGLKTETKTSTDGDGAIQAPLGTVVDLNVRLSSAACPVPRAILFLKRARRATDPAQEEPQEEKRVTARADDGKSFSTRIPVDASGFYRIEFQNARGRCIGRLPNQGNGGAALAAGMDGGYFRIDAKADSPPHVSFLAPNAEATVTPGGKLALKVKASDNYGLSGARLYFGLENQEPRAEAKNFAADIGGKTDSVIEYELDLGGFPLYSVIEYYATVSDNRSLPGLKLGPQTVTSRRFRVSIQDPAKAAEKKAETFERLRKRLMAILEMQISERVNAKICLTAGTLKELQEVAPSLLAGQRKIRAELEDLSKNFPFTAEMETARLAVRELATTEAPLAVTQAQVVSGLADLSGREKACELLGATQDDIIRSLQTLLSIMPQLERKAEPTKTKTGDDLPPDAEEKVEKLKNAMEEFQAQQKKCIAASDRLAKTPKDAFTADDEKVLKELTATQDKWEKFINEAITDFSKLLKQDFANPQLLKELVAVKTDVTMAKDALKKKATEIATAAEDNGVENAKSLTANLEKWLPDEPDRIKWAMEDMATSDQDNLEQAELPTELEDLVGDLLEQEEDLFDEMDDVSSKSSMSGDKGIGWDAMDGPISSMNAQGVTGNQLPNTSEIHGRSGEGRSGKCTGEFVEDKAVGKGGRRTPTRLTPEPFQKGQVNDTSTEPPGGATGGGKLSGSGEEGLEGPVPPPVAQEMKRLAGKQAALLNRAERIRTGFKVSDMSHYKLSKAMQLMDRVYDDLKNYRYQNVLRAKHATIKTLKDLAGRSGQIDVTVDASAHKSKEVRDDVADTMTGNLPEEYRQAIEMYRSRIQEIRTGTQTP